MRRPSRERGRFSYSAVTASGPNPYPNILSNRRSVGSNGNGNGGALFELAEEVKARKVAGKDGENETARKGSGSGSEASTSPELSPVLEHPGKIVVECPGPGCGRKFVINKHKKEDHLPTCPKCEFIFCLRCKKAYHGPSPCFSRICYQPEETDEEVQMISASDGEEENGNGPSPSAGSEARPYESTFYSHLPPEEEFNKEDISSAFFTPKFLRRRERDWPWKDPVGDCLPYPHEPDYNKYKSLLPGSWVEDELLEEAIQALYSGITEYKCSFLESFVLRFASKRDISDGVLTGIIKEKKLLTTDRTLALLNTDHRGHGGHWIFAWIFLKRKEIILLDSSIVLSESYYQRMFFLLLRILHIAHALEGKPFESESYGLYVALSAVQQDNNSDCGPLVVCNAYATMKGTFLRTRPKTDDVRRWIYNILKTNEGEKKAKLLLEQKNKKTQTDNSTPTQEMETALAPVQIPPFNPKSLVVRLRLFSDWDK